MNTKLLAVTHDSGRPVCHHARRNRYNLVMGPEPNWHAELHEKDIIVGLVEMTRPASSFENLMERFGLEVFCKVDVGYGFAEPLKHAWQETIGVDQKLSMLNKYEQDLRIL